MFDESQRLQENPHLLFLLSNYAQQGSEDRATWRDRLMQMEGVEAKELSALHGSLMAFDWIEQNTGQASPMQDGGIANCYRITLSGLREYGRFNGVKIEEKALETTPEKKKFPRKKKQESALPEAPIIAALEGSPEMPEMTEKQKQEDDSLEPPVIAASEESPETLEMPEKKKFPRKKKQKSDSPEAPVVAALEESLVPAA